jgi:hypothetical protein
MKTYRQGDVLIVNIEEFPEEVQSKLEKVSSLHLAEGEVTGHYHTLVSEAIAAEHGEHIFFEIEKNAKVTHNEHATIDLPAGKYQKIQQVEYTPEAYRNVAD